MKTKDYELFSFMSSNRGIKEKLVLKLMNSIKAIGYVSARPIIVSKDMIVIDGQHRLEACKRLHLPIYYEVSDVDVQESMVLLNATQQIWDRGEYIKSWAEQGIECYKILKKFQDKYNLGWTNSIYIIMGYNHNSGRDIRSGATFKINTDSDKIASFLFRASEFIGFWKTGAFVAAVVSLFKRAAPDQIEKVMGKILIIRQQHSTGNYLAIFENIINKHIRTESEKISLSAKN
jgi:hypothetical protein